MKPTMNWRYVVVAALIMWAGPQKTDAQSVDYYSGFYAGVEGGAISYNTQITFDGVDDPAGRGGTGYGGFLGYNVVVDNVVVGAELMLNLASIPDPYTFNPEVTGFSDLDLRREASWGLDMRLGYIVLKRVHIYGSVGFSFNEQSVRIDTVPLEQFAMGKGPENFVAFQPGAGVEVALSPVLSLRSSFRYLKGRDMDASDFGSIPIDAQFSRFDVEPGQQQFFFALLYRF